MISEEIKFSFKYLLIMIIPASLAYWGGTELINFLFEDQGLITFQEIISKATTIVFAISLIRFFKKDESKMYMEASFTTPLSLIFNAVFYIFLVALTLLSIKAVFNYFNQEEIFQFKSFADFAFNLLVLTILTIVNLTKNIKYFGEKG